MTEHNTTRAAIVGVAITVAVMAAAWLVGGVRIFQRTYSLTAVFSSAGDIGTGDPVRVAGIEVGKVAAVERRPQNVRIRLELDQGVRVSRETTASIRLRTLLGKKYVELADPGSGALLPRGGVIPLARTQSVTDVDEIVTTLRGQIGATDVDALNELLRSTDKILAGRGGELRGLLIDLGGLATTLGDRKADIDRLLAASDKLFGAVDERRLALGASVDGLAGALDALAQRRVSLSALVDGIRLVSERLSPLITRNEANLGAIIDDLKVTATVLDQQKGRVDLALDQLPDAIESLRKVTRHGPWIQVYTIGFPGNPFVAEPVDLGDNHGRRPGETGGLPQLWMRPPPHDATVDAGGVQVDTKDGSPPPPEGYYTSP